jgi:hypothetical protein
MLDQTRLIIPDIHHKTRVADNIRAAHPGIPAIFLGDYFDDFHDTVTDMRATCDWLRTAVEKTDDVFLMGNHCFAYLSYELGLRWASVPAGQRPNSRCSTSTSLATSSCSAVDGFYAGRAG